MVVEGTAGLRVRFVVIYVLKVFPDAENNLGYSIVRERVIFSIPEKHYSLMFKPHVSIPLHLAYVECYTALSRTDPNHGMFKISPKKDNNGDHVCSIVPIGNLQRSVHLLPKFGPVAPPEWTSSNVLDTCQTFFVNSLTDRHLYRITYDTVE